MFQGSEEDEHIAADDLISDFLRLVNQPAYSDAKIIVSSGQELHVHRLILSIRCPQLLQVSFYFDILFSDLIVRCVT